MARTKVLKTTRTEGQVMQQILDAARMLGLDLSRQNTGAAEYANADGTTRTVRYGQKFNSDLHGTLPGGRTLMIEVKHEGFDPSRTRGEERERFDGQLDRLRKTNALGGVGFFCDNSEVFMRVMQIVLRGGWVVENGYEPLLVFDPEIEEQP